MGEWSLWGAIGPTLTCMPNVMANLVFRQPAKQAVWLHEAEYPCIHVEEWQKLAYLDRICEEMRDTPLQLYRQLLDVGAGMKAGIAVNSA